jgi:hypothetical protein
MATKVHMQVMGACAMPALCCACGAPIGMGAHTIKVSGSDLKGKHFLSMEFPLCDECGRIDELVKGAGIFHRRKLPEFKAWRAMQGCVQITHLSYPVFGKPAMTIKFDNDDYARMFKIDNGLLVAS